MKRWRCRFNLKAAVQTTKHTKHTKEEGFVNLACFTNPVKGPLAATHSYFVFFAYFVVQTAVSKFNYPQRADP